MKNRKIFFENLFYNNKFLFVFSLLLAFALWTAVKVNFSENSSRTISDVKVTIDSSLAEVNDFVTFVNDEDLYVDVTVSGKSYDISSSSFSKANIIVEAATGYVDAAGYKVINLTARSDDTDVTVTGLYPSTITVFYDRELTDTFNVEAKVNKAFDSLTTDGFVVGQPVASMSTVEVSGPATVVSNINKVYFEAEIDESEIPLTATKDFSAKLVYELNNETGSQFLTCSSVDEKTNPASITIPVSAFKTVSTAVKFVNQPTQYETEPPKFKISPSEVKISYNPLEDESDAFNVGTIDFRQLDNSVNNFTFKIDETIGTNIAEEIEKFDVTIDFSSLLKKVFSEIPANVVILNQSEDFEYRIDNKKGTIDEITVIGPKDELNKITADDLQIEINVSNLDLEKTSNQKINVSNISITNEELKGCWIYGEYTAYVSVVSK